MPDRIIPWLRTERGRRLQSRWHELRLRLPGGIDRDILVLAQPGRIARSQLDPLYRDSSQVGRSRLFELPFRQGLERRPWRKAHFNLAIIQPWIDTPVTHLEELIDEIRARCPDAKVLLFDCEAPTHLRHAPIGDRIDLYVKKQVLKDWATYEAGMYDTTLAEYESQFDPVYRSKFQPGIPRSWLDKRLFTGWNFAGDVHLARLLERRFYESSERPIDIHARLQAPTDLKAHWYNHMRHRSVAAVKPLTGTCNAVVETQHVRLERYLAEMRRSKLCFSPFGYGEVCWRDFEAIACGAVVVKPDMSHLETTPNVYRPFETYAPVRWDFADLQEVCSRLLNDHELRREIQLNAVRVWQRYLADGWTDHWRCLLREIERD